MKQGTTLKVGLGQISPVWLDKAATIEKVAHSMREAGQAGCDLVTYGETLISGYPFWLSLTHASKFDSQVQKELHAHYVRNAVDVEAGDLRELCAISKEFEMAAYVGIIERPMDQGGHSLFASLVYIDAEGVIQSVHRKLRPTYEERLSWAPGDGNGLVVHPLKGFRVGGLNCWENWMPLVRAALHGQGENLHVAAWPGSAKLTQDITRFIAKEGRSFVVSVGGLMRRSDFPANTPHLDLILADAPDLLADGGSCVAGPDGEWLLPPQVGTEGLFTVEVNLDRVLEERQNFDPSGHYGRPDVTELRVDRGRRGVVGE